MSKPINISKAKNNDMTYSMMIDTQSPTSRQLFINTPPNDESLSALSKIQTRQRTNWVDDSLISRCFNCSAEFSFYLRYHHCRKCGNIFCYKCCNNWLTIPENIGDVPIETNTIKNNLSNMIWSNSEVRVCNDCKIDIIQIKNMSKLFKIFDYVPLTVIEYRKIRKISKIFNKLGNFYLSKYREIQYKLPYHKFTKLEKFLLYNNKEIIKGHSVWLLAYSRAFEECNIEAIDKSTCCKLLMCSRICKKYIEPYEILPLFSVTDKSRQYIENILQFLEKQSEHIIIFFIPLLIEELLRCSIDVNQSIIKFFVLKSKESMSIAGRIYWGLKIKQQCKLPIRILNNIESCQKRLLHEIPNDILEYIETTDSLIIFLNSLSKGMELSKIKSLCYENKNLFDNIRIPINPKLRCKNLYINEIKIKNSSSRPLFLPLDCIDDNNVKSKYYLLYKFEDVRRDSIIIDTIRLMDIILKEELKSYTDYNSAMKIITYNVFPTSCNSGLIEILPNCHTLYEIQKKFTIFNYILENNTNENVSGIELRKRFLKSCAAYCVITYLLGVGDRHLENIMVNKNGYLFHIDYGFIIGSDPKLITPTIKITSDMVDALGGLNSEYYKEFIQLAKDIHLCLQKRLPVLYIMLNLLVSTIPKVDDKLTSDILINELTNRFMYGENYEQSGIQLSIKISNSSGSYDQAIIDFFHYHSKEHTVSNTISNTFQWLGNLF